MMKKLSLAVLSLSLFSTALTSVPAHAATKASAAKAPVAQTVKAPTKKLEQFEIPEHIRVFHIPGIAAGNLSLLNKDLEDVFKTKTVNALAHDYDTYFDGVFNVAEQRRVVVSRCVRDNGTLVFNQINNAQDIQKFVNQKVGRTDSCHAIELLSVGEKKDNNYLIQDIALSGDIIHYPTVKDIDPEFSNFKTGMKVSALKPISTDAKKPYVMVDLFKAGDSGYLVLRLFNPKELHKKTPEQFAKEDVNNPDHKAKTK